MPPTLDSELRRHITAWQSAASHQATPALRSGTISLLLKAMDTHVGEAKMRMFYNAHREEGAIHYISSRLREDHEVARYHIGALVAADKGHTGGIEALDAAFSEMFDWLFFGAQARPETTQHHSLYPLVAKQVKSEPIDEPLGSGCSKDDTDAISVILDRSHTSSASLSPMANTRRRDMSTLLKSAVNPALEIFDLTESDEEAIGADGPRGEKIAPGRGIQPNKSLRRAVSITPEPAAAPAPPTIEKKSSVMFASPELAVEAQHPTSKIKRRLPEVHEQRGAELKRAKIDAEDLINHSSTAKAHKENNDQGDDCNLAKVRARATVARYMKKRLSSILLSLPGLLDKHTKDTAVIEFRAKLKQLLEQRKSRFPEIPFRDGKEPSLEGVDGLDALVGALYEMPS